MLAVRPPYTTNTQMLQSATSRVGVSLFEVVLLSTVVDIVIVVVYILGIVLVVMKAFANLMLSATDIEIKRENAFI